MSMVAFISGACEWSQIEEVLKGFLSFSPSFSLGFGERIEFSGTVSTVFRLASKYVKRVDALTL